MSYWQQAVLSMKLYTAMYSSSELWGVVTTLDLSADFRWGPEYCMEQGVNHHGLAVPHQEHVLPGDVQVRGRELVCMRVPCQSHIAPIVPWIDIQRHATHSGREVLEARVSWLPSRSSEEEKRHPGVVRAEFMGALAKVARAVGG